MILEQATLYHLWQKVSYEIVHKTTIWVLLVFFTTAGGSWHLGNILAKHNARGREANLAHRTAIGYTAAGIFFWLFSMVMG
ncbi:hypothetical protein [Pelosinus sp. UFO1]|uniref:hypothetical protein n=1 Tax=Pelosinus sp. UFO1 TaxID=484770 RepID=UPI0004D10711|nr:hypothetical protein [Pelosinus sp. UFO1]AIF50049.1 hypothetical protein UFO1_0488 [Pelosinus sp. UFO1]